VEKPDSTFHSFLAKFLEFVLEIVIFFLRFSEVIFLKTYWFDSGCELPTGKPEFSGFCGKARFPLHTFVTLDIICFNCFLVRIFWLIFLKVVFSQRLMVKLPPCNALSKVSDAKICSAGFYCFTHFVFFA